MVQIIALVALVCLSSLVQVSAGPVPRAGAPSKGTSTSLRTIGITKGTRAKGPTAKRPQLPSIPGLPKGASVIAYDSEKGHYHAYNHQMKHLGSVKHPGGPKGQSKGTSKSSATSGATSKGASRKLTSAPSRKLEKRDTSAAVCSPLSVDDVQKCVLILIKSNHRSDFDF